MSYTKDQQTLILKNKTFYFSSDFKSSLPNPTKCVLKYSDNNKQILNLTKEKKKNKIKVKKKKKNIQRMIILKKEQYHLYTKTYYYQSQNGLIIYLKFVIQFNENEY